MLHIIQNDPEVPPGNIVEHLAIPCTIHHPYRDGLLPEPEKISALIVLGGAMGANDDQRHPFLVGLKNLIRTTVDARIPYLGICLGGQLLASALGAKVTSNRWEEIGNYTVSLNDNGCSDQLFRGVSQEFKTLQWHHDSFDIPEEGVLLAYSERCPHQAFRVGTCAWGVQFHPEATEEIIRIWAAWDKSTSARTEELVTEFRAMEDSYQATVSHLLRNFLLAAKLR